MLSQQVPSIRGSAFPVVGTEAQFFEMAAQKLKDSTGRQYSASFVDPPLLGDGNNINPGLQVSVKEVFDVPPDVRPTQIVLHDWHPRTEYRSI